MPVQNQDQFKQIIDKFDKAFVQENYADAYEILVSADEGLHIANPAYESRLGAVLLQLGELISARIVFQSMCSHWDGSADQFIFVVAHLIKAEGEVEAEIVVKANVDRLKAIKFDLTQLKQLTAICNVLEIRETGVEILNHQLNLHEGESLAEVHVLFATLYKQQGDLANEAEHLALAVELDPKNVVVHGMAADLFTRHKKSGESLEHLQLAENLSGAEGNKSLAIQFFESCRGGSFAEQERLRKLWLKNPEVGQNTRAPFAALVATDDPEFIKIQNRLFAEDLGVDTRRIKFSSKNITKNLGRKDRIRIGYFSPDFRNHAVAHLVSDLLVGHDKDLFEVHCFSIAMHSRDVVRKRLVQGVEHFHEVEKLGTRDIAKLANNLGLDIAIDLAGYTAGFRPLLFERLKDCFRINFLGYPSTVGDPIYDFIIGDNIVTPEGYDAFCDEKIHRLARCYQCNSPSRISIPVDRGETGLPAGQFVFCNFNSRQKLNLETLTVWSRIISRCPDAVLWLLDPGPGLRKEYLSVFQEDEQRVIFAPAMPVDRHLGRILHANLFLDSFPYGAHTTASDAVFAGTPILSISGRSFQSRVSWSIMSHAGVTDLNTFSWTEYEEKAVAYYKGYSDAIHEKYRQTLLDFTAPTHPYNVGEYVQEYQAFLSSLVSS